MKRIVAALVLALTFGISYAGCEPPTTEQLRGYFNEVLSLYRMAISTDREPDFQALLHRVLDPGCPVPTMSPHDLEIRDQMIADLSRLFELVGPERGMQIFLTALEQQISRPPDRGYQ